MQFQVPQFIEVEDKLFGPLTLKQFIYVAGGVGISIVIYYLMPIKFLAILLSIPFLVFSFALAFYKINSKPFIFTLEAAVSYWLRSKLYIWKKGIKKIEPKNASPKEEVSIDSLIAPRLSDSKLKDLSWSLDINERVQTKPKSKYQDIKLSFDEEDKERVEFQKNYDVGSKSNF